MKPIIVFAASFAAGVCIGYAGSYIRVQTLKKKLKELDAEKEKTEREIDEMREYFDERTKNLYKKLTGKEPSGRYPLGEKKEEEKKEPAGSVDSKPERETNKQFAERMGYEENEIRRNYGTAFDMRSADQVMEDEIERRLAEEESPDEGEKEARYLINAEEYLNDDDNGYSHTTIYYNPSSELFTDAETGMYIDDPVYSLGKENIEFIERQKEGTFYIRNEKLSLDYEVEINDYDEEGDFDA